jgi:hypothetical protein
MRVGMFLCQVEVQATSLVEGRTCGGMWGRRAGSHHSVGLGQLPHIFTFSSVGRPGPANAGGGGPTTLIKQLFPNQEFLTDKNSSRSEPSVSAIRRALTDSTFLETKLLLISAVPERPGFLFCSTFFMTSMPTTPGISPPRARGTWLFALSHWSDGNPKYSLGPPTQENLRCRVLRIGGVTRMPGRSRV